MDYTPEQIKDIQERESKGLEYLKTIGLTPAAAIQKVRLDGKKDIFVDELVPFLKDTKYNQK